ncbi:hypothetical protein K3G39_15755 [Pontibacter sp. HSC-14F20]|uniref:hypothetical protein n=1 Tax=Pontibacter sp. HSC-14F20 TaxID=2864136 RepID=UPI001C734172|nr:hypothetical protein [Pontibacter sp. HSC-14F20]MBX0334695.1 hypothetical protein [Pontibacter sp. HSC-14F20]
MKQYKDNYCHINYNSITNQVYLKWLNPPDESALLCSYDRGLDMAISNKAVSWVADNSIGFLLDISMQRALAKLTASRLKQTSLRRFARVTPIDVFQELVTNKVFNRINDQTVNCLEYEVFHNPKDAQAWGTEASVLAVN